MRVFTISIALIGCVAATPFAARAQNVGRPFEFGLDAAAQFGLGDTHFTTIVLPAQRARIGYEFSNAASFEPFGTFIYQSAGGFSSTSLGLGAGILFFLTGNTSAAPASMTSTVSRIYVRPFAVMQYIRLSDGTDSNSDTEFGFGGGLGLRKPLGSSRLATRWEVNIQHVGGSDAFTSLGLLVGLSFFTR
jgi:hypothetical protein